MSQKTKSVILLNERIEDFRWDLICQLYPNGTFKLKGTFIIRDVVEGYTKFVESSGKIKHPFSNHCVPRIRSDRNLTKGEIMRRWYGNHREQALQTQFRRRRDLGFIPLNNWFDGADAHHIDRDHIIYIPERLHQTKSHCLKTGVGIDDMNMKAFGFLLWNFGVSHNNA